MGRIKDSATGSGDGVRPGVWSQMLNAHSRALQKFGDEQLMSRIELFRHPTGQLRTRPECNRKMVSSLTMPICYKNLPARTGRRPWRAIIHAPPSLHRLSWKTFARRRRDPGHCLHGRLGLYGADFRRLQEPIVLRLRRRGAPALQPPRRCDGAEKRPSRR